MTQKPHFDIAQDYIDEAIEMSEIDLNYRSGEGLRADGVALSTLLGQPKRTLKAPPKKKTPPRHGTSYAYTKCGCRCDECKAWRRDRAKSDRSTAKAKRAARRAMERRAREMALWHSRQCECPECVRWEVG